jgi:pSer/pThr/pTyr-binding forkhead associated (FHA) protein
VETTERITPATRPSPGGRGSSVTIQTRNRTYVFDQGQSPIVIGRDSTADVHVDDQHVSAKHLRLEHTAQGWVAVDSSLNGTFFNGEGVPHLPIRGATTIHLGHPNGVALTITEDIPQRHGPPQPSAHDDGNEVTADVKSIDPDVARAGAAVAARREQLDISQRSLAADGVMSAAALIDFEKGRRWPRAATRAKLEVALGWPQGRIASMKHQDIEPDDEQTVALTNAAQAPMMSQVIEVALSNIASTIESLPALSDPDFTARVNRVLADLRTLELSAAGAARAATGDTSMAKIVGGIRKTYRELMLRAARAPGATVGQQIFAARHRSELSIDEFANAAGVPVEVIKAAESEAALTPSTAAALTAALSAL